MVNIEKTLRNWEKIGRGPLSNETVTFSLSEEDARFLDQLNEQFPRLGRERLLHDLMNVALHDIEASLPYVKGNKIIALDEEGDALYEDIGKTPLFLALTQKLHKRFL